MAVSQSSLTNLSDKQLVLLWQNPPHFIKSDEIENEIKSRALSTYQLEEIAASTTKDFPEKRKLTKTEIILLLIFPFYFIQFYYLFYLLRKNDYGMLPLFWRQMAIGYTIWLCVALFVAYSMR